jgi:2'-5' RNA ligase
VKRDITPAEIGALGRLAPGVAHRTTVEARSIDVMQSELSSAGPRYTVLEAIPLGLS